MTERRLLVADSSPLVGLARIQQLELLPRLFSRVLAPPAVMNEVTAARSDAPGAAAVRSVSWIEIQAPDPPLVAPLAILLDRGEAEALALAQMYEGSIVLLDDSRARRIAERLGIRRMGTLGLLRMAKLGGLIPEARTQIRALIDQGIYIHQVLIDAVLEDLGEA
ncbi:MAG: DUF3368 domain-containing protein [Holophagales bacterium]|nr:DUF3368 domain-containing protein [Holophagales bacterium]